MPLSAPSSSLPPPIKKSPAAASAGADQIPLRQLRHHTKNALQRLICQIEGTPDLMKVQAGRHLAQDLARRIKASAAISDCLFGFTAAPGTLEERLHGLCDALLALFADPELAIRIEISIHGNCPSKLADAVLCVAHEFISNALLHGMYARVAGRILVRVATTDGRTTLNVNDDGWGFGGQVSPGEGLSVARDIAAQYNGNILLRRAETTEAILVLPHLRTS